MPIALLFPIVLRVAGPLAFIVTVVTAGAMNRSFILVPILALVATITTILIRIVAPSPATELKSMLASDPNPKPESPFRGAGRRFAMGLIGYGLLFGLSAWIAALFQTTEFEPQVGADDVWFAAIPSVTAIAGAWLSARLGFNQMANMMGQMQDAFAEMKSGANPAHSEDDVFTMDGEVIDPDDARDS